MSERGIEARRFMRGQTGAVLSTLSKRLDGFPFGSVSPFILDHSGRPLILISDLAEHTRNIEADPRVSLVVQPYGPDMQATGRVTVVGLAGRLEDKDKDRLGPRYLRYFPQAVDYFAMRDFRFYRIEPMRVRWVGGFGRVFWLEPEAYLTEAGTLESKEESILESVNTDYAGILRDCCRHFHGIDTDWVEMIGVDPDGFDVRADGQVLRCPYDTVVADAGSVYSALSLAGRCRT